MWSDLFYGISIDMNAAIHKLSIVGAGSAGSIVANRLSKHFNVLLLERGGEPNPLTVVPGLESSMLGRPEVDYRYMTVPQNSSCLSCNNRVCTMYN